jgi:hypothetical protein
MSNELLLEMRLGRAVSAQMITSNSGTYRQASRKTGLAQITTAQGKKPKPLVSIVSYN